MEQEGILEEKCEKMAEIAAADETSEVEVAVSSKQSNSQYSLREGIIMREILGPPRSRQRRWSVHR